MTSNSDLYCSDRIKVGLSQQNPNWSNPQKTGYGDVVLAKFVEKNPNSIEIVRVSGTRAVINIKRELYYCNLGGDEKVGFVYAQKQFIGSDPFHRQTWKLVTRIGEPVLNSNEELANKSLGIAQGILVDKSTFGMDPKDINLKIVRGPDLAAMIRMLKRKRFDVLAAPLESIQGEKSLHFSHTHSTAVIEQKLICVEGSKGSKELIDKFNQFLKSHPELVRLN